MEGLRTVAVWTVHDHITGVHLLHNHLVTMSSPLHSIGNSMTKSPTPHETAPDVHDISIDNLWIFHVLSINIPR